MLTYLLITSIVVIVVLRFVRFYIKFYKNKQVLQRAPAPPERFFLGHFNVFTNNPDRYKLFISSISLTFADHIFARIRLFSKKYYPIYRFSTPYITIANCLEPNDIELVLSSTKHLSKSKIYTILTPAFHFTILQQLLNIFNEETSKLVDKLLEKNGKIIDVVPPITNITLQSIAETAMGLDNINESTQRNYKDAIYKIGAIFLKCLSKPWYRMDAVYSWSKLAKEESAIVKVLHDFSNYIIKEREKEMSSESHVGTYSKKKRLAMLDLLLSAKNDGADIDYEGIREEVDTFMFEGHDTTSMTISFLLQDIQAKVSKYASEDFTTKTGYDIPEGTVLHIHIFGVHRNKTLYPDHLKFDPDRFLPENVNARHPFAYIPFNAGPRHCIGQKFALLELKAALCGILRKFKLEKVDDMFEVEFRPDLVLRPKKDIKVKILTRL
ncbi:hypothetical protein Zmor_025632 [Zophobas morio]|uniref:Cytochrome P450 n=1 Tax=Zophobas morio TaxID=2755281 RepID=A0AA38HRY8_9CUCU|nr:hypothetical protein Zmor_025632 [Zophobas morio]